MPCLCTRYQAETVYTPQLVQVIVSAPDALPVNVTLITPEVTAEARLLLTFRAVGVDTEKV